MRRFLVFAGDRYYPMGGWNDVRGAVDTLDEANAIIAKGDCFGDRWDWAHVVELETGEKVFTQ